MFKGRLQNEIFSTTNTTQDALTTNPVLLDMKPTTDRMLNGTALL